MSSELVLLGWIIFYSTLGSLGSIVLASIFLWFRDDLQKKLLPVLISYATGVLLAASLLDLIPEAITESDGKIIEIFWAILIGFMIFFVLEKLVLWHHCHETYCDFKEKHSAEGPIILIGDGLHNIVDGIVITAAFLSSIQLGVVVGISVIVHEVSQEIGDFAILIHYGYTRKKALILNIISGSFTIPASLVSYFILAAFSFAVPFILAISAASFLYIALTDLSPELHEKFELIATIKQLLFIGLGIGTMVFVMSIGIHV